VASSAPNPEVNVTGLTDLNVVAHVLDGYDLCFISFFAVLERWLI